MRARGTQVKQSARLSGVAERREVAASAVLLVSPCSFCGRGGRRLHHHRHPQPYEKVGLGQPWQRVLSSFAHRRSRGT